jgi:hypothetical protein
MALSAHTKRRLAIALGSWPAATTLATAINANGGGTDLTEAMLLRLSTAFARPLGTATVKNVPRTFKTNVDDNNAGMSDLTSHHVRQVVGTAAFADIDAHIA